MRSQPRASYRPARRDGQGGPTAVRCGSLEFVRPPSLSPGSLVAVVAPASPFDREELFCGLARLRTRYRLRLSSRILTRTGYTAAMVDPEVAAIVCARGGYGAMRILDGIPWTAFAANPKWLVGFSDVTALHAVANARGICSLHAPNVTGLGRRITAGERLSLIDALEGDTAAAWTELATVHPARPGAVAVRGPLVGGNLSLLASMAAAGRLAIPVGAILALEDVTERPYRVDRMVTALRLGGHLAHLSAIVLGGFTQCEPGPDGVTVAQVLADITVDLGIPVVASAPFGHGAPNRAFVLGAIAHLDGSTLTITPPASPSRSV